MENTAINLLTPFVSETPAAATGRTSGSSDKGSTSFLDILSRIGRQNVSSTGSGTEDATAGVSSAVLDSDVRELFGMIEAIAAGATVQGDDACGLTGEAEEGSTDASALQGQTPEKDVKNLLLGLLALFTAKKQAAADSTTEATKTTTDAIQLISTALKDLALKGESGEEAEGVSGSASSSESETVETPATDDQTTLEMLALILFNSLQAIQQNQEQSAPQAADQGQFQAVITPDVLASGDEGNITRKLAGGGIQTAGDTEQQEKNTPQTDAVQNKRLEGLSNQASNVAEEDQGTLDVAATGAKIELAPAQKESQAAGSRLTMTVTGTQGMFGQGNQPVQASFEVVDATGTQGNAQEDAGQTVTVASVVEDFSSLFEKKGEGSLHDEAGRKDDGGNNGLPFMTGGDASRVAGQEAKEKASVQAGGTGAVEKFQQVLDQFNMKASNHDLTVRLDIGNKESLLLGFKDMGQNIAVEVKASHQAVTDLLQSQKDAIVKHLESKDVHATIQIDPDASATTDRRDRREPRDMRQRFFAGPAQEDGGFGEYLEVFA
jgi:hypothetical protein